jgi:hypothetical protein
VESFFYLFNEPCPVVRVVWTATSTPISSPLSADPPSVQTLVCPTPSPPRHILLLYRIFVSQVWRLFRRRRYDKVKDFIDITKDEIRKVAPIIRRKRRQMDMRT